MNLFGRQFGNDNFAKAIGRSVGSGETEVARHIEMFPPTTQLEVLLCSLVTTTAYVDELEYDLEQMKAGTATLMDIVYTDEFTTLEEAIIGYEAEILVFKNWGTILIDHIVELFDRIDLDEKTRRRLKNRTHFDIAVVRFQARE